MINCYSFSRRNRFITIGTYIEDGIRDPLVTGVQTCALPIFLQAMREVNSFCKMIFIGEGYGGCTASDEFFDIIVEIEDETFSDAIKEYKQWWGIHDYPQLIK